jgi:branched-chain amino acid transport system ATP-binding protein
MLEIRNLSAGYGRTDVISNIDLDVHAGEIVALVGANGAGKSTLAKVISGLLKPSAGTVTFEGSPIALLSPAERVRAGLVHVPEGRQVFGGLTVEDNLLLGAYALKASPVAPTRTRILESDSAVFPVLLKRLNEPASNLSGGQQQMLAIARGLMAKPRLLILDEPSLGLSPSLVDEIFRLIAGLRDLGVSILLSEQNAQQALAIADRGYVLETGHIVLDGSAKSLLASPDVAAKYLGIGAGAFDRSSDNSQAMAKKLKSVLSR